jgi:hypothetical protein
MMSGRRRLTFWGEAGEAGAGGLAAGGFAIAAGAETLRGSGILMDEGIGFNAKVLGSFKNNSIRKAIPEMPVIIAKTAPELI